LTTTRAGIDDDDSLFKVMASDKQITANRRNARKSTGPKTATGRAASSRNAFRHGLTLPLIDDPNSMKEAHLLAEVIAIDQPGRQQNQEALEVALAYLAIRRVRSIRNQMLNELMAALTEGGELTNIKHLSGLERYERRARQKYKRTSRWLKLMHDPQ